jgi:hypothetical protein
MKLWSLFATFAVAGALIVSPAQAISPSAGSDGSDDRSAGTSSETLRRPEASRAPAAAPGTPRTAIIEGTVAAVERESGRFVLDTDDGPLSLVTSPDELTGVQVGDLVQVSLLSDDD